MKRLLVSVLASLAVAGGTATLPAMLPVATAHSCSSRYTHAVVGGAHKCLGSGQFCARRYQSTYRRHGYVCKRGSDGRDRLFRR